MHAAPLQRLLLAAVTNQDGSLEGGLELVATFVRSGGATRRYTDVAELAVDSLRAAENGVTSYYGLHPRRQGTDGAGYGTVALLVAAMVDIDTAKHSVPEETALKALAEAPWGAPTVVVGTGGGLHAFWRYKVPLDPQDPLDAALHREASRVAQGYVAKAIGVACTDDCSSLTQNSRLPGTINWKPQRRRADGTGPPVTAIRAVEGWCHPSDITEWVDVIFDADHPPPGYYGRRRPSLPLDLPTEVPAELMELLEACGLEVRAERGQGDRISRLRLGCCPACGSKRDCWVSPRDGGLHSFRQTGCPAGAESGPIDMFGWVERYRREALESVPDGPLITDPLLEDLRSLTQQSLTVQPPKGPVRSWAELRETVATTINEAATWAEEECGRIAVVGISPPGAGKTTEVIKAGLERSEQTDRGALLLFPSHKLAEEKLKQAQQIIEETGHDEGPSLVHVQGMGKLCPNAKGIASAFGRGYVASGEHSLHLAACGRGGCAYTAMLGSLAPEQVKFGVHAHLSFLAAQSCTDDNLVVVDELQALSKTTVLFRRDFLLAASPPPTFRAWLSPLGRLPLLMLEIVDLIQEQHDKKLGAGRKPVPFDQRFPLTKFRRLIDRAAKKARLSNFEDALVEAQGVRPEQGPALPRWRLRRDRLGDLPRADLGEFFGCVQRELFDPHDLSRGVICVVLPRPRSGSVRLEWRQVTPPPEGVSMMLLDATAALTEPSLRAVMPGREIQLFSANLALPGPDDGLHTFWIHHRSLARSKLFDEDGVLTERGEGSVRNVLATAINAARPHLPPGPSLAITAPRPLVVNKETRQRTSSDIVRLAREAGALGEIQTAYHFGLRGTNELAEPDLFINVGDPIKNLGVCDEEARLFGLRPESHAANTAMSEQIQTLHRSRALRVTPDRPKVVVHAGRMGMQGFNAKTIEIGSHRGRSPERLALERVARDLLSAGGATAFWIALDYLSLIKEQAQGDTRMDDAHRFLIAAQAAGSMPTENTLRTIWRKLCSQGLGLHEWSLRRAAGAGRPRIVWAADQTAVAPLEDDYDQWLREQVWTSLGR